jgi:spermidine synthase
LGDIFRTFQPPRDGTNDSAYQVAAIGLGTGAVACYAGEGCQITFVEVDPAVRDIAGNKGYFSYLSQCGRDHYQIVMADGRQAMEAADDKEFDLIFLDAFSSDAVPTHLMTREAIQTYIEKLANEGVLAFHISNKYLRLDRVLTAAAEELRLASRVKHDRYINEQDRQDSLRIGKADAWYFVIAKDQSTLQRLPADWEVPQNETEVRIWTDDYSNILSVMQFWR